MCDNLLLEIDLLCEEQRAKGGPRKLETIRRPKTSKRWPVHHLAKLGLNMNHQLPILGNTHEDFTRSSPSTCDSLASKAESEYLLD